MQRGRAVGGGGTGVRNQGEEGGWVQGVGKELSRKQDSQGGGKWEK